MDSSLLKKKKNGVGFWEHCSANAAKLNHANSQPRYATNNGGWPLCFRTHAEEKEHLCTPSSLSHLPHPSTPKSHRPLPPLVNGHQTEWLRREGFPVNDFLKGIRRASTDQRTLRVKQKVENKINNLSPAVTVTGESSSACPFSLVKAAEHTWAGKTLCVAIFMKIN